MLRLVFYSLLTLSLIALLAVGGLLWYIVPQLPDVESLRDVQLQTPLRVLASDGQLIAEFGKKRRQPVGIADVPLQMKQAFIAAEDDRFYSHPGVDWMAITRAVIELVQTREKNQGGSTITMQVARNFFLSPEKTYERKLKEVVLAMIIERELSKDEILELYLNKIFLGHRAYGVGAAAQVYYGVPLAELSLAQIATIAGLPKAPSRTNPISNPEAANDRRGYVLRRMLKLGYIDEATFAAASAESVTAKWHGQAVELPAPHIAEMVRDYMISRDGEKAYTEGFRVYTTLDSRLQQAATDSIQHGLKAYARRHGYRGPESHVELSEGENVGQWTSALSGYQPHAKLLPAIVLEVEEKAATVWTLEHGALALGWEGIEWARKYIRPDARGAKPKSAEEVLARGDIVRIEWRPPEPVEAKADEPPPPPLPGYWQLSQLPKVQGALVSVDSYNGAIRALVGGFDYSHSKFNRVTQAQRQPGSNFKPFIYSAALEKGFTAASFINDAPIVFDAPGLESAWRPGNYSGKYFGPTRLRVALTKSRNLVSIRLLRSIGINFAQDYVRRFGFDSSQLPNNLSMALGSGEVTPLEVVTGYAILANGGYKVATHFLDRIEASDGSIIYQADMPTVCKACEHVTLDEDGEPDDLEALIGLKQLPTTTPAARVVAAENAWIMTSILQDVISFGTGRRALSLKRTDLAGKTGTTNDQKDAWFSGFNHRLATTVWVGFDQVAPLGRRETGAQAALPLWIDFMGKALDGVAETTMERPTGLITVRIDPATGLLAGANHPNAIFESFRQGQVPPRGATPTANHTGETRREPLLPDQLF